MRVLVTGGAGFIGSHVVEMAVGRGHEVAVLDNLSTGKKENVPAGVQLFEVDLRDRDATTRVVADFKPEAVSHQAAQASVSVSVRDPGMDAQVNILGAIHLMDACVAHGVRRVVFASTGGAIYGEVPEGTVANEDTVPQPYSPYAISKLTVEHFLRFYKNERGMDYAVLRYANVYGPRQDAYGEAGVVAIFAERASKGEALGINARKQSGDSGCVRDYTYVKDVARCNMEALSADFPHVVMNVGTGVPTDTEQLAKRLLGAMNKEVPLTHNDKRAGDLERSVLDPKRCSKVLGNMIELEAGLAETVRWYTSQ